MSQIRQNRLGRVKLPQNTIFQSKKEFDYDGDFESNRLKENVE